jgi:hypothetical protein
MRRAARRDGNHSAIAAALYAAGVEVIDLSMVGGGCPDILCYRRSNGLLRLLEIKNPKGRNRVHAAQSEFARRLPVWVVRSVDEALAAMDVVTV